MNATRLVSLVLVIVTIAVAAIGWFLGIAPLLSQAATARDEQVSVDAQNAQYAAIVAQLAADFERIDEIEAEFDELQRAVPASAATEAALAEIAAAAAATGVVVDAVTFSGSTPFTPVAADGSTVQPTAELSSDLLARLFSVPITVSANGSYAALVDFVDRLQLGERLILVTVVSYSGTGDATALQAGGSMMVLAPAGTTVDPSVTTPTPEPTETPAP